MASSTLLRMRRIAFALFLCLSCSLLAAALARQIGVPANRISQIPKGERDITADTAVRLGDFFGTSPQFWLNLQSLCDLRLAEKRNGRTILVLPTLRATHTRA